MELGSVGPVGPVGPKAQALALAAVLCGALCLLAGRFLRRAGAAPVLAGPPGPGTAFSEDRGEDAGTTRRPKADAGAGVEGSSGDPATGQARDEAERAAAEAELRGRVSEWASELANRIATEPLIGPPPVPDTGGAPARPPGGPETRPDADPTGSGRRP